MSRELWRRIRRTLNNISDVLRGGRTQGKEGGGGIHEQTGTNLRDGYVYLALRSNYWHKIIDQISSSAATWLITEYSLRAHWVGLWAPQRCLEEKAKVVLEIPIRISTYIQVLSQHQLPVFQAKNKNLAGHSTWRFCIYITGRQHGDSCWIMGMQLISICLVGVCWWFVSLSLYIPYHLIKLSCIISGVVNRARTQ